MALPTAHISVISKIRACVNPDAKEILLVSKEEGQREGGKALGRNTV